MNENLSYSLLALWVGRQTYCNRMSWSGWWKCWMFWIGGCVWPSIHSMFDPIPEWHCLCQLFRCLVFIVQHSIATFFILLLSKDRLDHGRTLCVLWKRQKGRNNRKWITSGMCQEGLCHSMVFGTTRQQSSIMSAIHWCLECVRQSFQEQSNRRNKEINKIMVLWMDGEREHCHES